MTIQLPKNRRLLYLLPLALLLAGPGCKKAEEIITPKLPEATQDGKGTFGCRLDDQLWLPHTDHTLLPSLSAGLKTPGNFTLRASDDHDEADGYDEFTLAVQVPEVKPGTYTLGNGFSAQYSESGHRFVAGSANQGSMTITKVEARQRTGSVTNITTKFHVVSGTFSFTATSAVSGRVITIKEGRFDVQTSD
ncbi:hypothetical protein GCM10022408_17980 [Hymenobacter fastidiosus]|uniref:DUF4251 domain-containing protein n=1 Tax=Hymenobacter fastidiosus TaxID=486264 RepID=A0ABP7S4Z0_9BACT